MKEHIHHLLEQTVANLKSAGVLPADLEARVQVDRCKEKAHGDLATNLAMLLAKPARKNPRELAAAIIEHLPASDLIAKVEIAGPGFINFFFDPSWLAGQVEAMVTSANANVKLPAPQTVDRLPAAQASAHSAAILQALVAAAKADGHIDARERELIEGEYARQGLPAEVQQWLHAELEKPLDPAEVARAASTPEMAAEMYLASLLVADEQSFMERAYLDELARQLKLEPALQQRLQNQLVTAGA